MQPGLQATLGLKAAKDGFFIWQIRLQTNIFGREQLL